MKGTGFLIVKALPASHEDSCNKEDGPSGSARMELVGTDHGKAALETAESSHTPCSMLEFLFDPAGVIRWCLLQGKENMRPIMTSACMITATLLMVAKK